MSFSQFDEEEVLLSILPPKGRFLDIGASDGIFLSNTRQLALNGWGGVLVEPSPLLFPKLIETYRERQDIGLINAAVSGHSEMRRMFFEKERDWASSLNLDIVEIGWVKVYATYLVKTICPNDLIHESNDVPFDFVSIDAEWEDFPIIYHAEELMKGVKVVCIELRGKGDKHDYVLHDERNIGLLNEYGFKEHHRTPANWIGVK